MPWRAVFQDGAVKPSGAVEISVRYEQWVGAPLAKVQEFAEPILYAPNDQITQPIVRVKAMERVALLNAREGVTNAMNNLKEQDISTWPQV